MRTYIQWLILLLDFILDTMFQMHKRVRPGSHFIKVKIYLSLEFKINLIFYFIKECKKNMFLKFFSEIEDKINIKVMINPKFRTPLLIFMKLGPGLN